MANLYPLSLRASDESSKLKLYFTETRNPVNPCEIAGLVYVYALAIKFYLLARDDITKVACIPFESFYILLSLRASGQSLSLVVIAGE